MKDCTDLQHSHLQPLRCGQVFQGEQRLTNHILHRKFTGSSSSHISECVVLGLHLLSWVLADPVLTPVDMTSSDCSGEHEPLPEFHVLSIYQSP